MELFASVRSNSFLEGLVKPDPFLIVEYGDETYVDKSRSAKFAKCVPPWNVEYGN